MSVPEIIAIAVALWVIAMIASWCVRRGNALTTLFVFGVVAIAIGVSWRQVEQDRAQRQAAAAFYHRALVTAQAAPQRRYALGGS